MPEVPGMRVAMERCQQAANLNRSLKCDQASGCQAFGSGMVIYWHGVVEELREVDPNVLLVDAFPERKDIVMLARFEEDGENEDF